MVIATHLDKVNSERAHNLITLVKDLYANKRAYPPIADVCCVCATAEKDITNVRRKIYDIANHLHLVNNRGKTMCMNILYKPFGIDIILHSDLQT